MELKIYHHVFSSEGGYKTLHVSQELRPFLGALEGFAKRVYKKVKRGALRAVLRLDGRAALSKIFVAGSDHVGRLRSCVHTILPDEKPLQEAPFFDPFELLGRLPFLGEGLNLLAVAGEVQPSVEFEPRTEPVIPRPQLSEELARAVFMGMLSPHHEAVAADPTPSAEDLIAGLYPVLPPFIRRAFAVLMGAYLPPVEDGTRLDFFVLPGRAELDEFKASGKLLIDVERGKLQNVPASSPYCDMVMDACFGRSDGSALKKLLWLMERNEFSAEPTWDVLRSLVEAFSHVEKLTTPEGKVVVSGEVQTALKAVVPFARGGYADLAASLLRAAAGEAAKKSDTGVFARDLTQLVEAIEGSMDELKKQPAQLFQRLAQLSDALLKFFAQRRSGQQGPPTETMVSWDF